MTDLRRVPTTFYIDHRERGLPTPPVVRGSSGGRLMLDIHDPAMPDLISDAEHYAHPDGPDTPGLRRAARALLLALRSQGDQHGQQD